MSDNSENRRRALAEVVSVDAWHEQFGHGVPKVDLHVDVVFENGRVGAEKESPVRFRLSVRQAEVVILIPELEPASVDKKSVSRDAPRTVGKETKIVERAAKGGLKGSAGASFSPAGVSATLAAEVGGEASITTAEKVEFTTTLETMIVVQSITPDGHYRWNLKPTNGAVLAGRPWDAVSAPRLKLIDLRKDRTKGIPPTVRVEVRCRREDLKIEDIEIKNETVLEAVKRRSGFDKRLAAAEAYIRDRLTKEGLVINNFQDAFGELTLASTTAEPQSQ